MTGMTNTLGSDSISYCGICYGRIGAVLFMNYKQNNTTWIEDAIFLETN